MINLQYNPYNKKSICLYNFSIIGNNSDETISQSYTSTSELKNALYFSIGDVCHGTNWDLKEQSQFLHKLIKTLEYADVEKNQCYRFFSYLKPLNEFGDFDLASLDADDHGLHITVTNLIIN